MVISLQVLEGQLFRMAWNAKIANKKLLGNIANHKINSNNKKLNTLSAVLPFLPLSLYVPVKNEL